MAKSWVITNLLQTRVELQSYRKILDSGECFLALGDLTEEVKLLKGTRVVSIAAYAPPVIKTNQQQETDSPVPVDRVEKKKKPEPPSSR